MSDYQLEREYKAVFRALDDVLPAKGVCDEIKSELIQHSQAVIAEYNYRRGGEYAIPLHSLGIWDWWRQRIGGNRELPPIQ